MLARNEALWLLLLLGLIVVTDLYLAATGMAPFAAITGGLSVGLGLLIAYNSPLWRWGEGGSAAEEGAEPKPPRWPLPGRGRRGRSAPPGVREPRRPRPTGGAGGAAQEVPRQSA